MPTKEEILAGLTRIANEYSNVAIAWHVIIILIIAALFSWWRPANSFMILLLSSLLMSVSIFAALQGNRFNAVVFAFLVIISMYSVIKSGEGTIRGDRSWPDIAGLILIVFGLVYPEFIDTASALDYTYLAPTGLIPCPTLCILIGFALLYKGFRAPNWSLIMSIAGIFYGAIGVFYLEMYIDWFLVAGSIVLLLNTFLLSRPSISHK